MNLLKPSSGWSVMSKKMCRRAPRRGCGSAPGPAGGARAAAAAAARRRAGSRTLRQRHLGEQRNQPRNELRILRGSMMRVSFMAGAAISTADFRALIFRAVHDVGPAESGRRRARYRSRSAWTRCAPESWCRTCRWDRRTCAPRKPGRACRPESSHDPAAS
jgi:hypothetical protein